MRAARLTKPLRARIRAGHPWIYDRAVALPSGIAAGELVSITDEEGAIAIAFADPTSPIRARVLADAGTRIDARASSSINTQTPW